MKGKVAMKKDSYSIPLFIFVDKNLKEVSPENIKEGNKYFIIRNPSFKFKKIVE